MDLLNQYGADSFFIPVAVKLEGTDYLAAADDPELAAAVRKAGGAYFAGGDQGRITRALRRPDGSNSLVLEALWEMYRGGGVIAGSSAGAAIMSSTMFDEPRTVLATLKQGVAEGHEIAPGLGLHRRRRVRRPAPAGARPLRADAAGHAQERLQARTGGSTRTPRWWSAPTAMSR